MDGAVIKTVDAMKFTIRDLLWLTLLAAIAVTWWLDRSQLASELDAMSVPVLRTLPQAFRPRTGPPMMNVKPRIVIDETPEETLGIGPFPEGPTTIKEKK